MSESIQMINESFYVLDTIPWNLKQIASTRIQFRTLLNLKCGGNSGKMVTLHDIVE